MSIEEWMKMCTYIQWNINSDIKKNEIMSFATTWMDLENVILTEVRVK